MKTTKLQLFGRRPLVCIALAAIIAFTMIACGGGDADPESVTYSGTASDGSVFTLAITENTARYAAQAGDSYRLTITFKDGTVKISVGTVSSASGETFTLQPSGSGTGTFTVAVSGESISAITGAIAVEGGDTVAAPRFPQGGSGGDTLILTGQTDDYFFTDDPDHYNLMSAPVRAVDKEVSVADGTWTVRVTPVESELAPIAAFQFMYVDYSYGSYGWLTNASFTPADAKFVAVGGFTMSIYSAAGYYSPNDKSTVAFIYVDRAVTAQAEETVNGRVTSKAYSISLDKGWNAVSCKREGSYPYGDYTFTMIKGSGDDCRWRQVHGSK